uniref:Metalloendopeptidase n=1 Tax=Steinernema glaseri TaxID=37863 RepID=A0A1I7Y270_9BILA
MGQQLSDVLQFDSQDIWDSDAMYAADRFEGDIANADLNASTVGLFVRGISGSASGKHLNALRNMHQLWKGGRIPYMISSRYSSYSRSMIASAMEEYHKQTCIKWVPKTNNDIDYIYIFPDRGCYSMVGRTGGRQSLSLGSGCIQKGIIIHEMMHAVGFFHEQSRTDRDTFITILWNNIQPGMHTQFEKYGHGTIQDLGTEYDYQSIMHYGSKAFSRNGQATIVPKRNAEIGQRGGFSKVDMFKINKLYDCAAPSTSEPQTSTSTSAPTTPSTTERPYPSPPTLPTIPPVVVPGPSCKNTRPDCNQLAQQGWCKRNPDWMKNYCPEACDMCEKTTKPPTVVPIEDCIDLRVDCASLVKQRYCLSSATFMKSYCAKSCGFCGTPLPEIPVVSTQRPIITTVTATPLVSFSSTVPTVTTASTQAPPTPYPCRDMKHFCAHWKGAGFCEGLFRGYMTKNCPKSCGFC